MLQTLLIQNFQIHKKLRIDFDPYVTTIIGPSDVGKSAIIRSLKWLIFNRPGGEEFINSEASSVKVKLLVDSHVIKRSKGKQNLYSLDDQVYKAFGHDVPPAIAKLLNIQGINLQSQFDNHFWFSLSAGQVSRELNQIVDLGIIDKSLSFVASKLHHSKTTVDVCRERLKTAKQQYKELEWVEAVDVKLGKLEAQQTAMQTKGASIAQLSSLLKQATQAQKVGQHAATALSDGRELVEMGAKAVEVHKQASKLQELITAIKNTKDKTCQLHQQINELNQQLPKDRCPLCGTKIKS